MSYEKNLDLDASSVAQADSLFGKIVDGFNSAGSLLIFAMMALMCADVLMRNLANQPIHGVAELVAMSVIAIVFMQLASTLRHGRMSRADIFIEPFTQKHPHVGNLALALFSLIGVLMCSVVTYATWAVFYKAWNGNEYIGIEGVFTAPTWPVRAIVIMGCVFTAIQYALHTWQHLKLARSA